MHWFFKTSLSMVFVLCGILVVAAPASGQIVFTEAWAGTWNLTYDEKDCDSGLGDVTLQRSVTIEANDPPSALDPDLSGASLSGSITDTKCSVTSSSNFIDPPCTIVTVVEMNLIRTQDSVQGQKVVKVTATNCSQSSSCTRYDITGNRSGAPVETRSWSALKALYH